MLAKELTWLQETRDVFLDWKLIREEYAGEFADIDVLKDASARRKILDGRVAYLSQVFTDPSKGSVHAMVIVEGIRRGTTI